MQLSGFEPATVARSLGIRRSLLYKLVRRNPALRLVSDIPSAELVEVLVKVEGRVAAAAELLSVSRSALGRRFNALGLRPEDPEGEGSR